MMGEEKVAKKESSKSKEQESTELDYKEMAQRIQAEFINFKSRSEKERSSLIKSANKDLIVKLLPLLDQFELAIQTASKETEQNKSFIHGFELLYAQLIDILKKEGVQVIDCLDKPFDPECHEALIQEESKKESGTVIEVLQKGYSLNSVIIRTAKVKVSK